MKRRTIEQISKDWFEEEIRKAPKQHPKITPECMTLPEMKRYAEGDDAVINQFMGHYETCPDYCQKSVARFVEYPNGWCRGE